MRHCKAGRGGSDARTLIAMGARGLPRPHPQDGGLLKSRPMTGVARGLSWLNTAREQNRAVAHCAGASKTAVGACISDQARGAYSRAVPTAGARRGPCCRTFGSRPSKRTALTRMHSRMTCRTILNFSTKAAGSSGGLCACIQTYFRARPRQRQK